MNVARITPNNNFIMDASSSAYVVLVPSVHLSFFKISLPAKSMAQCHRIVAFSLEEELAEDISQLHYAVQRMEDEWFVVVCAHEKMQQWLNLCHENGLHPKKIIPDVLVLPETSNCLIEPDQCLLRLPGLLPMATYPSIFEDIIGLLPEHIDAPTPFVAENYEDLLGSDMQIDSTTINLLQNEYSKTTSFTTFLRPWLKVALWGGLLWSSIICYLLLKNQQLETHIAQTKQHNVQQFRKLFPQETRIVNLRTQAEQKFRQINQQQQFYSVNFIGLTESVITALEKHQNVKLSQLDYSRYALRLYVNSNSLSKLQNFINQLKGNTQLDINVQSLDENNGKARSTINVRKTT